MKYEYPQFYTKSFRNNLSATLRKIPFRVGNSKRTPKDYLFEHGLIEDIDSFCEELLKICEKKSTLPSSVRNFILKIAYIASKEWQED
ncbi:MAG: hypothetical protein LBK94_00815 [Prevotellaceae bacterium]|jgi:hypothetical protein|nr:hypothetical protein [Prevotellaceae bacterium]